MKKLPILIIIPHGGYKVPEELSGLHNLSGFDLFTQADTCANDIFNFGDRVSRTCDTPVSRLFIDLDRPMKSVPPLTTDGVIKNRTLYDREIFSEGVMPDEISMANLIKRYYVPFHDRINSVIRSGSISLVLECHTAMSVAPANAVDKGMPRPIIDLHNSAESKSDVLKSAESGIAGSLLECLEKELHDEEGTVTDRFRLNPEPSAGHILARYGKRGIPMIRLTLSKALFLNDRYFSHDYLRVDEIRIHAIREKIWSAVEHFYRINFIK